MKKIILQRSFLLAVVWAIIIFVLCATPGHYIPSAHWLDLFSVDKFVHASVFFVLTILCLFAAAKENKPRAVKVGLLIICVFYGGLLEIMQATLFVNRGAEWLDFVANSVGCLLGWLLFDKLKYAFELKETKIKYNR
jgi:VanZ family protein